MPLTRISDITRQIDHEIQDIFDEIVAGSGGLVISVFGRTGTIVSEPNDYTWAQINKTTSSLADITTRSATDLTSGTLPAARMPALTGDITSTVGTVATTIANNVVSLAKLADITTASFLGRNTIGIGDPEVLSVATAQTMLGLTGTNSGDVTLTGENYLTLTGQLITANPVNLGGTNVTGTLTVNKGGTGQVSYAVGDLLYASASTTLSGLADVATGNALISGGVTTAPSWGKIGLTTHVSGVLGVTNGGTGTATAFTLGSIVFAGGSGVYTQNNSEFFWDNSASRLGLGTNLPSQRLEVVGNVFLNTATANLYMKDTSTGWQVASTTIITPQANNTIRSTSYTSGLVGWNISATDSAEFNNVDVRGAIHTSLFVYNAIAATAGTLGVFKTAAKLRSDVTIPAAPTYGTTTVTIDVDDPEGLSHAASQVLAGNDIIRLKDGLIGDTWLKINAFSDQTTFWRYSAIIMAGSNNVTYRKGMAVADYGQSGQGFIIQTADQTNAPYLQMATHTASFTSNDSAGTLTVTPRLRAGNLNGSYGYAVDVYGFGAGQYGTAGQSWLTVDPTNGVRIGNNTTVLTQVDAAGNASFSGSVTASSGTIAGWTISSNRLSSGTTYLASGFDIPSGQVAWFGKGASGYQGISFRDTVGRGIDMLVGNSTIFPYTAFFDGTRFRVVIGGLNFAFGSDGSTNSMGMKIWSSAGTKLVEFSDIQNIIAGWTIGATSMSSGTGATTVAMDSGGTNPAFYAGSATPGSAPFRVTNAGALTATNATITGAITATSGSLSALSITGLLTMSGASAAITIGTTPPTSASAGTGIWLDRTGLYGLAASVVQTKIDAATGAISAGGDQVTLDVNGINFANGITAANRVKWFEGTRIVGETWTGRSVSFGMFTSIMAHSRGTGAIGNDELTSMSIVSDNGNTNGGGSMNLDIIVNGPAHASRPNQQVMYATWIEGIGSPALKGSFIVGPGLGFTTALTTSTALEVRSTTGAFLLPRMTTTQKNALTATDGMLLYDSTLAKAQIRAAGVWVDLH